MFLWVVVLEGLLVLHVLYDNPFGDDASDFPVEAYIDSNASGGNNGLKQSKQLPSTVAALPASDQPPMPDPTNIKVEMSKSKWLKLSDTKISTAPAKRIVSYNTHRTNFLGFFPFIPWCVCTPVRSRACVCARASS